MSKIDLIDNSWVDLVFEGKNHSYGAYRLRKNTGKRNLASIIIVLVAIVVIMAAVWVKIEMEQKVVEKVKSSVKFTAPVIKKDEDVAPEDELKSQDDLAKTAVAIGSFDVKGNDEAAGEVLKAKEVIAQEKPVEEKVFDVVEQMPQFPGGDAALFEYLSTHIKYPTIAEENGVQGRVIVTFVVERDGSITDVKVVKSVDPSLDKEASRVVAGMPKWIPGKQNGSAVRVKYTVPVTFRLQ